MYPSACEFCPEADVKAPSACDPLPPAKVNSPSACDPSPLGAILVDPCLKGPFSVNKVPLNVKSDSPFIVPPPLAVNTLLLAAFVIAGVIFDAVKAFDALTALNELEALAANEALNTVIEDVCEFKTNEVAPNPPNRAELAAIEAVPNKEPVNEVAFKDPVNP